VRTPRLVLPHWLVPMTNDRIGRHRPANIVANILRDLVGPYRKSRKDFQHGAVQATGRWLGSLNKGPRENVPVYLALPGMTL